MGEMGDAADAAELLPASPRQIHELWPTNSVANLAKQPYRHQAGYSGSSVGGQVGQRTSRLSASQEVDQITFQLGSGAGAHSRQRCSRGTRHSPLPPRRRNCSPGSDVTPHDIHCRIIRHGCQARSRPTTSSPLRWPLGRSLVRGRLPHQLADVAGRNQSKGAFGGGVRELGFRIPATHCERSSWTERARPSGSAGVGCRAGGRRGRALKDVRRDVRSRAWNAEGRCSRTALTCTFLGGGGRI